MTPTSRQCGFSLLEMLVAISILALALGSLYQAASGATRNVRTSERYAYGVELARSLLADNAMVPQQGVNATGETAAGYQWRVESQPRDLRRSGMGRAQLHDIEVGVAWFDGSKRREIVLNSVVEAYSRERR
ncbi:prepilin-type N-terminal cleavage/methylation domain-containing protein [Seongchinamella unica]|uniref:Prepilin-type N-terminal cleavage/methylation domain-containing protein n=1 Tax=Seongchinamella unica TaxID=2547392 RepID=A0A4R5LUT2_9GAMM|nr:prepilin-type N-terminal cleavage/methylation domain-containing protein [Seongchinamella unica]TDG15122.1 prepilin-type N-terminal cleavage/methylation domain-containing protein [Seongchinamella unica]